MKTCEHGNRIDPPGLNCLHCMAAEFAIGPNPGDNSLPADLREEFLERAMAYILRQSMADAGGNNALGVATALKRAWICGFKTGQSSPAKLH